MRMDDNLRVPAATPIVGMAPGQPDERSSGTQRGLRFTSNVVGSMYFITDILCFLVSAPITAFTYSEVRGLRVVAPVHITAFILMLGSYLLIRSSRHAYRRSLLDLRESSD